MSLLPNLKSWDSPIPSDSSNEWPVFEVVYVDGDILSYEIGCLTDVHPFDPNGVRIPVAPEFIYDRVDDRINRIIEVSGCSKPTVFLTGDNNFRFDIATLQPYKGNRSDVQKPYHHGTVRRYLQERYSAIVVNGREADDALAIGLRSSKKALLCSRDKDLWTVSGWHYRWACGDYQPECLPHFVTEEQAHAKFFTQMLIGDTTDNILGCAVRTTVYRGGFEIKSRYVPVPFAKRKKLLKFKIGQTRHDNWRVGVGKKEAEKALVLCKTAKEMFEVVRKLYQLHRPDDWEEAMLENARLLYMGQNKDNLFDWSWLNLE